MVARVSDNAKRLTVEALLRGNKSVVRAKRVAGVAGLKSQQVGLALSWLQEAGIVVAHGKAWSVDLVRLERERNEFVCQS